MRQRAKRDSTPRNAPSGHSTRQKKRGMTRFMPTSATSIRPTNQAPGEDALVDGPGRRLQEVEARRAAPRRPPA